MVELIKIKHYQRCFFFEFYTIQYHGGRNHNFFDGGVCDRGTTKNATRWAHEHIGDPKLQCYRPCHGFRRHLDE